MVKQLPIMGKYSRRLYEQMYVLSHYVSGRHGSQKEICHMTPEELNFLTKEIRNSSHYLEFGSGVSTIIAANTKTLETIDAVESDSNFFQTYVASDVHVAASMASGRLQVHYPYLGVTKDWGVPVDSQSDFRWPCYSLDVFSEENSPWDLLLVDGRFRVACCMAAFLAVPHNFRLLVHDFWDRPQYSCILEYFTMKGREGGFVLLEPNRLADRVAAKQVLRRYQYLPCDQDNGVEEQ
jgi:hypothetical protein